MTAAAADPFVHEGLFYRSPKDYLAGTVPFVLDGLAASEPVLVAVPAANLDLIRDELGRDADRVRLVDMGVEGRNPGRIIPGVLRAFVDSHQPTRARVIGEPIWAGRSADEYPACVQHEALINDALAGRAATILCPYDLASLDPAVVADAVRTHPVLVEAGQRRPSSGYAGAQPVVDEYNRPLPEPVQPTARFVFAEVASLAAVRRLVTDHGRRAGLDADRIDDLQIVANELCTNTLAHTGGPGVIRLWHDDYALTCEVTDGGTLTDPLAGRIPPALDEPGGRGLLLVNFLCDLVRIHTDRTGTTVRVQMVR